MTNPEVPQGQSLDDLNLTLAHLLPAMRALLAILEGGNQEAGTTLREMMQTMMAIEQGLTALAARPDPSHLLPRLEAIEQRLAAREAKEAQLMGAVNRLTALLTAPA